MEKFHGKNCKYYDFMKTFAFTAVSQLPNMAKVDVNRNLFAKCGSSLIVSYWLSTEPTALPLSFICYEIAL